MKTLYESILDDIDTNLEKGEDDLKKVTTFGYIFDLTTVQNCSDFTAQMFSIRGLKAATKGMDYINDKVARGRFDSKSKLKLFCKLLDNIQLNDLGLTFTKLDDNFRRDFAIRLQEYCNKLKVFNNTNVDIFCPSGAVCEEGELRIFLDQLYKPGVDIQLKYKLNK